MLVRLDLYTAAAQTTRWVARNERYAARERRSVMMPAWPFRHEHRGLLEHIDHLALAAREDAASVRGGARALRARILDSCAAR